MRFFCALLKHEIRLQVRQKTEWAALLLFFVIVVILTPFALGPDPDILRRLAPGIIWLSALLMCLMSLDQLFVQDYLDGTLDEILCSAQSLELIILAKMLAQSLILIVVLTVVTLPSFVLLNMDLRVLPILILTLVIGIPILVFLGGIAGSLIIGLNRNAALMTLLLIPFYIPAIIFAVSACDAALDMANVKQALLLLTALLALILPSAPFMIASTLRQGQG